MLKETIRQLVSGTSNLSLGGQLQVAGVSAAEQKALLGELKEKSEKNSGYAYMWS